jgi:hypothetical protein
MNGGSVMIRRNGGSVMIAGVGAEVLRVIATIIDDVVLNKQAPRGKAGPRKIYLYLLRLRRTCEMME